MPPKTTITTEIMGGLGNQLFQIFNLMAYSFRYNSHFYFSPEPIRHGIRKTTYWSTPFLQALNYFVKEIPHNNQLMMYHERNFHYEEPQPPPAALVNQTFKFFGYFQSYKYFEDQQDIIYKFIRLRETQANIREKTKQPQYDYDYANTVALHFRVGDYKNLPNHHPLMTLEYYTEALTRMGEIPHAPSTIKNSQMGGVGDFPHRVLYFCEKADQEYIQEKMLTPLQQNPLFKNKFTFQCIDHNLSDWEQLIVMTLCRHHIIANSTFSWWGAYLGLGGNPPTTPVTELGGNPPTTPVTELGEQPPTTNINSHPHTKYDQPLPETGVWACEAGGQSPHVYYPAIWFGPAMGNKNLSDLFPPHWHRINI